MEDHVCSSSRGLTEIILRVLIVLFCVGTLVCAAIALHAILDVEDYVEDKGGEYEEADLYKSGAAWLILTGTVGASVEVIAIILRLCNLSCCNENPIACGVLDVVFSGAMGLCLLAGGIANAKYAEDNADLVEDNETRCNLGLLSSDICADLERVKNFEITSAAAAFVTALEFGILAVIMIVTVASKPRNFV